MSLIFKIPTGNLANFSDQELDKLNKLGIDLTSQLLENDVVALDSPAASKVEGAPVSALADIGATPSSLNDFPFSGEYDLMGGRSKTFELRLGDDPDILNSWSTFGSRVRVSWDGPVRIKIFANRVRTHYRIYPPAQSPRLFGVSIGNTKLHVRPEGPGITRVTITAA